MAVKIKFDSSHNVIHPTFVLATRNGNKIGRINATNISISDSFNSRFELNFQVYKYDNGTEDILWSQINDFRLVWCKEWDIWFEMSVELQDDNNTLKNISCISLGESELSQIVLYNIEINTEDDILRDDYVPTVLFDEEEHGGSLLHRIMEKAPHYSIKHVDLSIAKIQRTFSFNGTSLYNAFGEIAEEINCIFVINSGSNEDGTIERSISVYDLESYCLDCGTRDNFTDICPECKSENIMHGYGDDTSIFISTENLADEITFSTDNDSVKNCFRLEAGDDLMTSSIRNANPNGSQYIWFNSEEMKKDMSQALLDKLSEYDKSYDYYLNEHITVVDDTNKRELLSNNSEQTFIVGVDILPGDVLSLECSKQKLYRYTNKDESITEVVFPNTGGVNSLEITSDMTELFVESEITVYRDIDGILTRYNNLVSKYSKYTSDYKQLSSSIVGYGDLMNTYYDVIDFYLFLNHSFMPSGDIPETTAQEQANLLPILSSINVAVQDLEKASCSTASSAVLAMAKTVIDSRYQVKVYTSSLDGSAWSGSFSITNYTDEDDSVISDVIHITITDDIQTYTRQRIDKALSNAVPDAKDIVSVFSLNDDEFKDELKKYCLVRLQSFYDACQACINILIEQGAANDELWDEEEDNLYNSIYIPYYNKLSFISDEILVREREIQTILGKYDAYDDLEADGMQTILEREINNIQSMLNLEGYLGADLWLEFVAYRREDTYRNDNYISDGLNNRELLDRAVEFINVAKKEIYKSATLQHSISASLKNLLVMQEFLPIVDYFSVGNWIRVAVDGQVYRLRLISYTINFEDLDTISIEFSDVKKCASGLNDTESIMEQSASMASTYDAVTRQATQGKKSKQQIDDWVTKGLSLTKMKIVDDAKNQNITWDSNGFLCREYLPITDSYSDKQLKIINRGLYLTDNNWLTSKAGIGDFTYYNPETGEIEEAYGVIADTLVGNLMLSEKVGVYTEDGNITLDKHGLIITADNTIKYEDEDDAISHMSFAIQKKDLDADGNETIQQVMYIDSDGNLVLNGSIRINTSTNDTETLNGICDKSRFDEQISNTINNKTDEIYNTINEKYAQISEFTTKQLEDYKTDLGQYLSYNEGTGLILGAKTSNFKTVIDNQSMRFQETTDENGIIKTTTVAYVSNQQLYIPNAVIKNSLILGSFFFSPHDDGSVSLTWQG